MRQVAVGGTVYAACDSFVTKLNGVDICVTQGQTAREGHELIVRYPHLFKPFTPDFEVSGAALDDAPKVEQATAAPGERRA